MLVMRHKLRDIESVGFEKFQEHLCRYAVNESSYT
jgi:hypothetical protein